MRQFLTKYIEKDLLKKFHSTLFYVFLLAEYVECIFKISRIQVQLINFPEDEGFDEKNVILSFRHVFTRRITYYRWSIGHESPSRDTMYIQE